MENMLKVSVIVPVYNTEKYLGECLDSIVNQTLGDIEIIIINDGSTDSSQAIIDKYQKEYPLMIKAYQQENKGLSATRNIALQHACGKYVAYIDADDYVYLDYLKVLYDLAEKNDSEVVICSYDEVDQNRLFLSNRNSIDWEIVFDGGLKHTFQHCACPKLYRRDFIINNELYFQEGEIMEDVAYGIVANSIAAKPVTTEYHGYQYRINNESIMGNIRKTGVSKKENARRFPCKGLENAIIKVREYRGKEYDQVLEFVIAKALAGFLFVFSEKSSKEDQKYLCDYTVRIFQEYFPNIRKNPYIRIGKLKKLPLVHRVATKMLVLSYRLHVVYPFVRFYTGVQRFMKR